MRVVEVVAWCNNALRRERDTVWGPLEIFCAQWQVGRRHRGKGDSSAALATQVCALRCHRAGAVLAVRALVFGKREVDELVETTVTGDERLSSRDLGARAVPVAMGSTEQVIGDRGGRPTPAGRFCSWKVRGDHVGLSSELLKVRARTSTVGTVCIYFRTSFRIPCHLGGTGALGMRWLRFLFMLF